MDGHDDPPQRSADESEEKADGEAPSKKTRGTPPSGAFLGHIADQVAQLVSNAYPAELKHLASSLVVPNATNWFPQSNLANLLLPQIKLPTLVDPALLEIGKSITSIVNQHQAISDAFTTIFEQQRKQWDSLFSSQAVTDSILPPNWKGVKHPTFPVIETITLDEGIPLVWVPGMATLQTVFDAPDAAGRRRVLGARWKRIVLECESVLGDVNHADLQRHQPSAADVVRAIRDGHTSAAQALAANLLDSVLRRNFDKDSFKKVTTNKKNGDRFDVDAYEIRAAFTLAPIWRAYAQYWEDKGDPIPRTFGRHRSAHAVSRTQYSRINAVVALMLVTSLLKLLDGELVR